MTLECATNGPIEMDTINYRLQNTHVWICAFIGIAGFSLTLPMTRLALTVFDPIVLTLGRALIAALLGAIALLMTQQKIPPLHVWWRFALVSAGAVFGFPLLSSLAMQQVPAAHGAVITGLIPLVSTMIAVLRGDEKPAPTSWATLFACCALVLAFAVATGSGHVQFADWSLLAAVIAAGVGYAEGTLLARQFGHWQTICWALLLSVPISIFGLIYHNVGLSPQYFAFAALPAWCGFIYVGTISMFAAFMLWYRALAVGGIARVGQLQFLQPFLTIMAATFFFGETLGSGVVIYALGILLLIFVGQNLPKHRLQKMEEWR